VVERDPYFQFFPADWLLSPSIGDMCPAQEGAYIRLLAWCWRDPDCGIPDDDASLAKRSRLGDDWATLGKAVREMFVTHPKVSGKLTNSRLFAQWVERQKFKAKQSDKGKKSAKTKRLERRSVAAESRVNSGSIPVATEVQPAPESGCDPVATLRSDRIGSDRIEIGSDRKEEAPQPPEWGVSSEASERPPPIASKIKHEAPVEELCALAQSYGIPLAGTRGDLVNRELRDAINEAWQRKAECRSLDYWRGLFEIRNANKFCVEVSRFSLGWICGKNNQRDLLKGKYPPTLRPTGPPPRIAPQVVNALGHLMGKYDQPRPHDDTRRIDEPDD